MSLKIIKEELIDEQISVGRVLRRCKILSTKIKNKEFELWINKELNGYIENEKTIPFYRKTKVDSIGIFQNGYGQGYENVTIPISIIPEELKKIYTIKYINDPIEVLEKTIKISDGSLYSKWSGDALMLFNKEAPEYVKGCQLMDAKITIPITVIVNTLSHVRNNLLDFILKLEKEFPEINKEKELKLESEKITNIFNNCLFKDSNISAGNNRSNQNML